MTKSLCIHGHFYQPPRFDPWLEEVMAEGSAAPEHDWNARITKECYAPLAWARRLDGLGRIEELVNCYAWISFNFGPTLLTWMQRHAPETYARILAADRDSLRRLGHGNALAQVYHHVIMPLSTDLDKSLETAWAIQDFRARFGRDPEGMWLAETAVDLPTLETLVKHEIGFTILAPRQAKAVRPLGGDAFVPVDESSLDTTRPYLVRLPSGKSIAVFFYQGETSRAVAFERLLENGENFWKRLTGHFGGGLRHIATDGESYGHHFMFGEMALAYVVEQGRQGRDGVNLTNYASYLAAHPPTHEVLLHENTSWSCAHGLERWKTHCGCTDGGHPDWIQDWRRPLRRSLNYLKYYVDEHYFKAGSSLFTDPGLALEDYGRVLAQAVELSDFLDRHLRPGCTAVERRTACRLLVMQKQALAGFSSCAWFFDDIARIEPLNGLTAARRALDLLQATGGPDIESGLIRILSEAQSNMDDALDGGVIWSRMIATRRPSLPELARYVLAGEQNEAQWPGLRVQVAAAPGGYQLRAAWSRTMDEEEIFVTDQQLPLTAGRHDVEIGFALSRRLEAEMLRNSRRLATELAGLLMDFTEGQSRPQAMVAMLAPGLVWNWVFAVHDLPADVRTWLSGWLAANPDLRQSLSEQIEAEGLRLAQDLPANAELLEMLIPRCRELNLPIYWWRLQNQLMGVAENSRCDNLSRALNLASSGGAH